MRGYAEISTCAQFIQPLDWLLRIQNVVHVLFIWHSWVVFCRRCASRCLECGHCLKKSWTGACALLSSYALAQVSPMALYLALHAVNKTCKLLLCCHHFFFKTIFRSWTLNTWSCCQQHSQLLLCCYHKSIAYPLQLRVPHALQLAA